MTVRDLVAPGRSAGFDADHGQIVNWVAPGTLFLSTQKVVANHCRSALLYLPGVMRLDVRPMTDTLQVIVRPLHPETERWGSQNTAASPWGTRHSQAEVPWHGTWICMLATRPLGLIAKLDVYSAKVYGRRENQILAHGIVRVTERDLTAVVRNGA